MRSFFEFIKAFLMNRVLSKAPGWLLCLYYEEVMEPKANDDFKKIEAGVSLYRYNEMHTLPSFSARTTRPRPLLVGLIGLPGVGKTTLAEALTCHLHAFRVDSNAFRNLLIDAGCDYTNIDAIVLKVMLWQLSWGESVILDSDCMSPLKRAFVEALAKPLGVKEVKYLHIVGDRGLRRARVKAADDNTLKMYANGVRRERGLQAGDEVPIEEVHACVEAEWKRQEDGHINYATTLKAILVPNNGTKEELTNDVTKIVALHFSK